VSLEKTGVESSPRRRSSQGRESKKAKSIRQAAREGNDMTRGIVQSAPVTAPV